MIVGKVIEKIERSLLNCLFTKKEGLFEALKGNKSYVVESSCISILLQKIFYMTTFPLFALLSVI